MITLHLHALHNHEAAECGAAMGADKFAVLPKDANCDACKDSAGRLHYPGIASFLKSLAAMRSDSGNVASAPVRRECNEDVAASASQESPSPREAPVARGFCEHRDGLDLGELTELRAAERIADGLAYSQETGAAS